MLYSTLKGGVGNCLFIIANLHSLSIDREQEYCVSNFTNSCTKRPQEEIWMRTIFKLVQKQNKKPKGIKLLYRERGFNHQRMPNDKKRGMMIDGYWQSPKYFNHNRKQIIELFTVYKNDIQPLLDSYYKFKKPTISIHVRRADYLKLQHAHVVQNEKYYKTALQKLCKELDCETIEKLNEKYTFVIFSDDINWCSTGSKLFKSFTDKHFMRTKLDLHDLYLMSMCDHHIIANSTFSWWSAYLNDKEGKKVVAPSLWFNPGYMKPEKWQDIYDKDWIIV